MITTIYHVSVSGSHELCEMLTVDKAKAAAFETEVMAIRGHVADSGSNSYDKWEEWAEFHNYALAMAFEAKLKKLIAQYETQVEAWHKAYYAD